MRSIKPQIELQTASPSDRIALRGVRLQAELAGMSLKATLEQTFVNLESKAIEAVYTFPLPETAAVCGFEVITGDHVLTAKVDEADAALKQYDGAIAEGDAAFMLEQVRDDVFSARVGNLKPRQAVKIKISYVAPLERVDRSLRVRFPTTIAPRYASAAGSNDILQSVIDADALNPPQVLAVPYGLELRVDVRLGSGVRSISSLTHAIKVGRSAAEPNDWSVEFAGQLAELDRDVVLQIDLDHETAPQVQVASGPDGAQYLAVTFLPEFDLDDSAALPASETVFMLDCSGSMAGESISQATAALGLCLRSLSHGDAFNICRFGSRYELLAPEPLPYSDSTLSRALAFVRRGADLGGTEIHAPLQAILSTRPTVGEIRNVILLTDGQVSNEPQLIELARQWRTTNRLFTFGIGSAASGFLVRQLARVTSGAAEFISGVERIEDKVLRTFSRICSPPVTQIQVDWGAIGVQAVAEIPPVFDGDILSVFARTTDKLPHSVSLRCCLPAGTKTWSVPVPAVANNQAADDHAAIPLQWARSMIQSLEDQAGHVTSRPAKYESSCVRQLIELSKQHGVLCSRTAFVAIEHRTPEEREAGMPELRRIPVQLAHGWGGIDSLIGGGGGQVRRRMSGVASAPAAGGLGLAAAGLASRSTIRKSKRSRLVGEVCEDFGPEAISTPPADPLLHLLSLQSADGWFDDGYADILQTAGLDVVSSKSEFEAILNAATATADSATLKRILATLIVLRGLRRLFADRRVLWRRADAKARKWLTQVVGAATEPKLNALLEPAAVGLQ
jgi:Ca-activated chloride channel family protein